MTAPRDTIAELTPAVGRLLDKHLQLAKEWFPHELVPWGCGRDFVPGEAWDVDEHDVPDGLRSALFVNLLTEDNLPYYFNCIDGLYGSDDAWGTWARQWTAEEGVKTNPVFPDIAVGDVAVEFTRDDDLSVAVSDFAEEALSDADRLAQQAGDSAYAASLPESQRCG